MILIQSDLWLFFGRFHSLVVHLPIGFFLLGSIFFFLSKRASWHFLKKALPISFLLATIGAILAAVLGWLLAAKEGYNGGTLFWHRSLGIATAVMSGLLYLHFSGRFHQGKNLSDWGLLLGITLLMLTGHLGGQLTHGSTYLLDYAPPLIKKIFPRKHVQEQAIAFPMNPDSIYLFEHLIRPVLDQKCVRCHHTDQARGGLNLQTKEGLLAGGNSGDVLEAKPQQGSTLLHRVTLESNHVKYMPPQGLPMSYAEVRLLEYWIDHGYSFRQTIADKGLPSDILDLIKKEYGLSNKRRSYVEVYQVSAADPSIIHALEADGFTIKKLSKTSNFLEVIYRDSIDCGLLQHLIPIKDQMAWLNLSRTGLTSTCLVHVQDFTSLTRLQLAQNPVDNGGLIFLKDLHYLESLNLFQTNIDEEGLSYLEGLEALQYLYLGETNIDSLKRDEIKTQFPNIQITLN